MRMPVMPPLSIPRLQDVYLYRMYKVIGMPKVPSVTNHKLQDVHLYT